MNYLRVPTEITLAEVYAREASFSPGMYRHVIIPARKTKPIRDLLVTKKPFDRGTEPGSMWYMKHSTHALVRTKALQDYSYLIYPKGDAIVPVNPRVFDHPNLRDGDILMSKDSNVGECAIVDGDGWKNHMFSGGIVRLHPAIDRWYLYSFLKHPLFKAQLHALTSRGATITHAKKLWLDCLIPFPDQEDADAVIRCVSALIEAIVDKEKAIREKNRLIDALIVGELERLQDEDRSFVYHLPTSGELHKLTRLDTGLYSEDSKRKLFFIRNYKHGTATYEELGFEIGRGQNLQVSCIGESVYSDEARPNFYRLVAPTDISEFRTVRQFRYLGNRKPLSLLKEGDVIFGAEGFCKGRVVILTEAVEQTITNIHGIVFHPKDGSMTKGIFLGCFLGYLRNIGLVDAIGAGGSGGSLAIGYFHLVPFPRFTDDKQDEIARIYHSPAPQPHGTPTLSTFVDWHRIRNARLGICELDREMKGLQHTLALVQDRIIEGKSVKLPI